jgi:hypothetical protein
MSKCDTLGNCGMMRAFLDHLRNLGIVGYVGCNLSQKDGAIRSGACHGCRFYYAWRQDVYKRLSH